MTDSRHQAQQRERLTRWVREHGRPLLGFLTALVRDRHLADDLLQEVFARAWQARESYEDSGRERAYLLRIADRLACDQARKPRREQAVDEIHWRQIEPASETDPPWQAMSEVESGRQLEAALDALTEPQRRTLLLKYYGSLEFHEIASILGCPLNTVLSQSRRGLLSLRRILAEKA